MSKAKTLDENARISAAVLRLAAVKGWSQVTVDAVAKATKISAKSLLEHIKSSVDLVPVIAAEIDREAFAVLGKVDGAPHDVLFDLLMARFDVLQKHRAAILSMADAARMDRALSCALARATMDGAYRIIDVARLSQPARPILASGLVAVYGWAFWVWKRDESRDMAKTMAALDRALRLAAKALELIRPRS